MSRERGEGYTNLALLTDGLRAEREQGITIDVAYRYFATPKRKFIIADTPGHVQYTRNMVTGASTADLALILVDARKGIQEQSRRHAILTTMLRVPHIVLCVNKMDLVDYSQEVFDVDQERVPGLRRQARDRRPVVRADQALNGDNVVTRSANMPWYEGASLLHMLEDVHIASDRNLIDSRFPVQYVIRPMSDDHHDYRGFAGTVAGGVFKVGDEVMVLPSGLHHPHRVDRHVRGPGRRRRSRRCRSPSGSHDEIDTSRGSMICRRPQPAVGRPGHRRDDLLDGRDQADQGRRSLHHQAHHADRRGRSSRKWRTSSTSTRCTATSNPASST